MLALVAARVADDGQPFPGKMFIFASCMLRDKESYSTGLLMGLQSISTIDFTPSLLQ